jgi:hypothetical protein
MRELSSASRPRFSFLNAAADDKVGNESQPKQDGADLGPPCQRDREFGDTKQPDESFACEVASIVVHDFPTEL